MQNFKAVKDNTTGEYAYRGYRIDKRDGEWWIAPAESTTCTDVTYSLTDAKLIIDSLLGDEEVTSANVEYRKHRAEQVLEAEQWLEQNAADLKENAPCPEVDYGIQEGYMTPMTDNIMEWIEGTDMGDVDLRSYQNCIHDAHWPQRGQYFDGVKFKTREERLKGVYTGERTDTVHGYDSVKKVAYSHKVVTYTGMEKYGSRVVGKGHALHFLKDDKGRIPQSLRPTTLAKINARYLEQVSLEQSDSEPQIRVKHKIVPMDKCPRVERHSIDLSQQAKSTYTFVGPVKLAAMPTLPKVNWIVPAADHSINDTDRYEIAVRLTQSIPARNRIAK